MSILYQLHCFDNGDISWVDYIKYIMKIHCDQCDHDCDRDLLWGMNVDFNNSDILWVDYIEYIMKIHCDQCDCDRDRDLECVIEVWYKAGCDRDRDFVYGMNVWYIKCIMENKMWPRDCDLNCVIENCCNINQLL